MIKIMLSKESRSLSGKARCHNGRSPGIWVSAVEQSRQWHTENERKYVPTTGKQAALWVKPSGHPKRCPHCGSWVKLPCLACQLFAIQQFENTQFEMGD